VATTRRCSGARENLTTIDSMDILLPDPVAFAIPVFMLLIFAEVWWSRRHDPRNYELRDTAASLVMGLGNLVLGVVYGGVVFAATKWAWQYRSFGITGVTGGRSS